MATSYSVTCGRIEGRDDSCDPTAVDQQSVGCAIIYYYACTCGCAFCWREHDISSRQLLVSGSGSRCGREILGAFAPSLSL
jgi:hypothetical protein